uniref:Uncharacterized protein n=1 Tax=Amphora coffeiformis TaxID=265554 RepID=A0A7S3LFY2_9STRA|mmetsp:Transcript_11749/g.22504  ORF Transcript_11749/g.22504 Transcript_11749/m.22504 type:complete len:280 (+) Transcript_11749:175-1014(+)|eukprot:scaffold2300_cov160-Amphora_coffeaeformis.AAC.4
MATTVALPHCESPCPEQNMVPEGAIYWYEEETVVEDEDYYVYEEEEYIMDESEQVDFTEVTYESECPTEDDILLGTLPPAPPLADSGDLMKINNTVFSEQRLLEAMRKKRDEVPTKTTVPGTEQREEEPRKKNKQKHVSSAKQQRRSSAPPVELHHSPTGVWEDLHVPVPQASHEAEKEQEQQGVVVSSVAPSPRAPRIIQATRRVKKIDEIVLRHDERRAFALPSADPRLQLSSLQKVWITRIDHQVASMERHLHSMEREMMKIESSLAAIQKSKISA